MEPTPCSQIVCARFPGAPPCLGSRCSQWVPKTHGSPPIPGVGICADNRERLMKEGT